MNLYKNITIEVFLKRSTPIGPTPYVNMEMLKMSICTMVIQYVKYGRWSPEFPPNFRFLLDSGGRLVARLWRPATTKYNVVKNESLKLE